MSRTKLTQVLTVVLLLLVLLSGVSCRSTTDEKDSIQKGTIHPSSENIPDDADVDLLLTKEKPVDLKTPGLAELASRISTAKDTFMIGVEEGDLSQMLGEIKDITSNANGDIFILDSRYNNIKVYNQAGDFLYSFGRAGEGPGEFQSPAAFEVDAGGNLFVLDRNRQLKVFRPGDASFTHQDTYALDFTPEDLCLVGDRIYIRGYKETEESEQGNVMHAYSRLGEHLFSFGEVYQSTNPMIRNTLSSGPAIVCSDETETIATIFEHVPIVYGYDSSGTLKWRAKFADFKSAQFREDVTESGRPEVRFIAPEKGTMMVRSLEKVSDEFVLAQIMEVHRLPVLKMIYHTYLISFEDREAIYLGDALPNIHGGNLNVLLMGELLPYPHVEILRYGVHRDT